MKHVLKKVFRIIFSKSLMQIKNITQRYEFISFDMFDTLVKRTTTSPEEVYYIVQEKFNTANNCNCNFAEQRIRQERILMEKSASKAITLEDIYAGLQGFRQQELDELKELEQQIEIRVCHPNKPIVDIFNSCIAAGKKVVITSDMHLSADVLRSILAECQITGFDKLYVSGMLKRSKQKGNLYDYVCEDLDIEAKELVHIGDGIGNDFLAARRKRIKALLIKLYYGRTKYKKKRNDTLEETKVYKSIFTFLQAQKYSTSNELIAVGYQAYGPLLYGFCDWLYNELRKKKIEKVFFFARDGFIMQKAFDEYIKVRKKEGFISKYLYVSSRSLAVPAIYQCENLADICGIVAFRRNFKVSDFIEQLGLESKKYSKIVKACNLKMDDMIARASLQTNEKVCKLFEAIKKDVFLNSENQYKELVKYFEQEEFAGNVAIVDIGWYGHIQQSILALPYVKENCQISGFYLGLCPEQKSRDMEYQGYLYKDDSDIRMQAKCFVNMQFLEMFFTARHGTTLGYESSESKAQPILGIEENDVRNFIKIEELQKGALEFLEEYAKRKISVKYMNTPEVYFRNVSEFFSKPLLTHIDTLGEICFHDVSRIRYVALPQKLSYYLFHFKELKKDFSEATWKIGFLKKLFKVNLPYAFLLEKMTILAKKV